MKLRDPINGRLATLILGSSLAVCGAHADPIAAQTSASPLARDFEILVDLVEETHPDPYTAFGGIERFRRTAAAFREEAEGVETVAELHALAQRFLARLGDGHTTMGSLSGRADGASAWGPIRLGIARDALYIRSATPALAGYIGARVLAVNNLPVAAVLDSIRVAYPSENVYGAMHRLQRSVVRRRAGWPAVLQRKEPLQLTVATRAGDTVSLDLPFVEAQPELVPRDGALDLSGDNELLYGKVIRRGDVEVGYFVWNAVVSREVAAGAYDSNPSGAGGTFDWLFSYLPGAERTGDLEEDLALAPSLYDRFERLLEEMEATGAEHLLLDLRRNSGGMTPLVYPLLFMLYGDAVIDSDLEAAYDVRVSQLFLSQRGLRDIESYNARHGTDLSVGDIHRGYIFRNDLSLPRDERRDVERFTFSGYGAEYLEPPDDIDPRRPRVIVLTSPSTFSAAFHLTYYLTEIGPAVTVGVPPRQAPNAFMEGTAFTLPRSRLRGTIANAVQRLYPADDPRARVFTPDFPMSWADFRRYDFDPDAEILFALDLILSGRIQGR